jgi:hypothetical protein
MRFACKIRASFLASIRLFSDLSTNIKPMPRKIKPIKFIAIILAPRDSILKN